jgi:cytochrome o ubiquinol oxidase subunit 2
MRSVGHQARIWPARFAAILTLLLLTSCEKGVLNPQGAVGEAELQILIDSMAIMLAIVIPTIAATLAFAWWFRASNKRAEYLPEWTYSGRIELIVWGIPLLTIMLLGGVTWIASHQLDPAEPLVSDNEALEVQVVSLDWKWLFIYPDQHVASVNQLTVPANTPIHFVLTSASVMNSFFVPQLGSQIYTMNGMSSQLNLIANKPGTYGGISAHYSGDGFSDMYFDLHAVPAEEFKAWVTATRSAGQVLDAGSYAELAKQSIKVAPFTYRDADPALFRKIVSQEIPPAPGPPAGYPSVNISNRTEH